MGSVNRSRSRWVTLCTILQLSCLTPVKRLLNVHFTDEDSEAQAGVSLGGVGSESRSHPEAAVSRRPCLCCSSLTVLLCAWFWGGGDRRLPRELGAPGPPRPGQRPRARTGSAGAPLHFSSPAQGPLVHHERLPGHQQPTWTPRGQPGRLGPESDGAPSTHVPTPQQRLCRQACRPLHLRGHRQRAEEEGAGEHWSWGVGSRGVAIRVASDPG